MKKRESGITLLTLVVTIIVMLILAGIALRLSIGDNGIIGITGNTVDKYTNASDQEQEGLNGFVDEFNEIINGGGTGDGGSGDEDITITDKPTISIADWNTTGGIVEISTKSEYTTQYRIGKTKSWEEYTGQVNVDNGDTIYARYSSDEGVSQTVSKIIEDTNGPEVTISNLTVDGGKISITVTAVDNEMGMPTPPTYNYYIKPHSETYYESVGHDTTGEYTFTNLQGNTSYDIRVSTTDIAGNQGVATTNSETGSTVEIPNLVPGSNIYFDLDPSGPTNGNVNVTIRVPGLEEPLYIEYSIDGTDNWIRYEKPVEMTNNGRVYARVTDGKETSNEVYVDVTNIDRTKPDVSAEVQYPTGSDSITVVVTPNDPSDPDNNNFKYDYYIKEEGQGDDQYKKDEGADKTHTFDELEQNKSYDIKVEVTDPAGNKTVIEIPGVTTGEVPSGIEDGNIEIIPTPTEPTNGNVTVTIKDNLNEGYEIQYSITKDGKEGEPQNYTQPFEVDENCFIKAWFTDGKNAGDPATLEIDNIDKEAPVASANPEKDTNKVKERNITVTIEEKGTAGFNTNQGINYKWTTENTGVPEGLSSLPGTNEDKANTIKFTVPSDKGLTGTYYLYVGPVADKVGNSSEAKFFGPYEFENKAPSISISPDGDSTYKKEHSVTVNAEDATVRKYVWTQSTEQPEEQAFTETFNNNEAITKSSVSGDWYLWIYVEDNVGNSTTKCSNVFKFDNTAPEVSFQTNGNNTPSKVQSTIVNIADDGYSSIDDSSLKYIWSTSDSGITETSFSSVEDTYTNGGSIQNSTLDGTYYLWIIAKDTVGNTTVKRTDNPFVFDNTLPKVTFTPVKNETPAKSQSVKVSVSDTNLNTSSLKYVWTEENSKPQATSITNSFNNNESITINEGSGNRYVWILAYDIAGNELIEGTGPFLVDNNPPSVSLSHTGTTSSITVNVSATDDYSGIASYSYTIKQVGGSYTATETDGATHTFSGLTQGTKYTVTVSVKDGAGNINTKTTEEITTGGIPEGEGTINIDLEPQSWTNGNVTVTITKNVQNGDNLHIEYKIGQGGTYERYNNSFTVSQNTTIYAKLVDDAENEGSAATAEIAYIDKVAPTVSASPTSDYSYTKTKSVTINVTDKSNDSNIAGFKANQSLKYAWSTSSTQAPSSYSTLSGYNTAGTKSISFNASGSGYTGAYYLWIQSGSLTDQAENTNTVTHFGPYYFDNTAPTLNGSITFSSFTSKSISISVPGIKDGQETITSPKYTYYIKKSSQYDYTQEGEATTTTTHTFSNLDDNTSYDIKVTFTDNAGNVGQATATKSTVLVPTLTSSNTTFTLSNTKWTNKPITVTIFTTVPGYTLQYSTNGSTYQRYTGPITVSSNLTVYARLWDERNSTENVGTATTKQITNIDTSLSDLGVIVKNEETVDGDTVTKDKNDNPITIPDGFTPQKDPDSSDPYNPTVDDGVIVKDGSGNEFVWIPVGTIYTDSGTKTINYNRYTYANWVNGGTDYYTSSMKIKASASSSQYFSESLDQTEKSSAVNNKGFYLGRYEAGVSSGVRNVYSGTSSRVEIKRGLDAYNYVTQSEAKNLAENMAYVQGYSGTTKLVSSYAWDTALKFLEQTGNTSYLTNSSQGNYYNTRYGGKSQTYASTLIETGETTAVKHLYDLGGNVYEWTTERYSNSEATKVSRGGFYGFNSTDEPVIGRFSSSNTRDQAVGFRVALFL